MLTIRAPGTDVFGEGHELFRGPMALGDTTRAVDQEAARLPLTRHGEGPECVALAQAVNGALPGEVTGRTAVRSRDRAWVARLQEQDRLPRRMAAMIVQTREWGPLEVSEEQLVQIPEGLFGFEGLHRFVLADIEECRPFLWLLSVEDPDVGFALADPGYFQESDYHLNLLPSDEQRLGIAEGDTLAVFAIVTMDAQRRVTANLRGPVVLNTRTRVGRQIIAYGAGVALRQPVREIQEAPVRSAAEPAATRV